MEKSGVGLWPEVHAARSWCGWQPSQPATVYFHL